MLGDHPSITISPGASPKFFGAGDNKLNLPNLEEKLKKVTRDKNKMIAIGDGHTRLSITAPGSMLEGIKRILDDRIGISLNQVEKLEIPE